MVSAVVLARKGIKVTILERNSACGKKIIASGNGRCNYWNQDMTVKHYYSSNIELLKKIINKVDVLKFLNSIGLEHQIKNGLYYPYSNQSITVRNALLAELKSLNVNIHLNEEVLQLKKSDKFTIITNKNKYTADKVVCSFGSNASITKPVDNYKILKSFGHNIVQPLPALVGVTTNKNLKLCAGVRTKVKIKYYENNKFVKSEIGELQLNNNCLSGICVMQLSTLIAKGLNQNNKEYLNINFLYGKCDNDEECITFINNLNKKLKNRTITEILDLVLNYKLVNYIMSQYHYKKTWDLFTSKEQLLLARSITNHSFEIIGTNSMQQAQVSSGGVLLNEINVSTMESLKMKDLYITGEALDVDGNCGGYNLGFAFTTGIILGESINDKN